MTFEEGQKPDSVTQAVVKKGEIARRCLCCGALTTYVTVGFPAVVPVCSNTCHKVLEITQLRGQIK
jgi:hypothetical protein